MKKHLLFALVLLMSMPMMAQIKIKPKHGGGQQQQGTTLTVVAPRNQSFWLFVDNVLQNEHPVHSVCIRNLWPDDFYVRVELNNQQQNCVGQMVHLSQSKTITVIQSGLCYGLEYSQAHIRPELTIDLVEYVEPVVPQGPNNYMPAPPVGYGMNPQDYEEAYQLISDESFDNTKLTLAKQVIESNPMSASQIVGICKLFSFENNKLEFAKFAYNYCADQNKYYLLNEAFTYESSKRELDEYIRGL